MKLTDGPSLPNPNPVILPSLPRKPESLLQARILEPSIAPQVLAQQCAVAHRVVAYPVNEANIPKSD